MIYQTKSIIVKDGLPIFLHQWIPENPTKTFLLVHGAVEHAKRYDEFARKLVDEGYIVIAPDLRGHGLTAEESGVFSHFGNEDGFLRVIDDLLEIHNYILKQYPNLPRVMFGHSLGSFLTRKFVSLKGTDFKAVIFCGTSWGNTFELKGGAFLGKIWSFFSDKNKANPKFDSFLWGQLNAKVKGRKGEFDFINSDEQEIEKYLADPLNGNPISIEFGMQMSKGLLMTRQDEVFENTPNDLCIYLASGIDDPLSNKGKDILLIADKYKEFGLKNVEVKLYESARHEIINERNKEKVLSDMINWLNKIL